MKPRRNAESEVETVGGILAVSLLSAVVLGGILHVVECEKEGFENGSRVQRQHDAACIRHAYTVEDAYACFDSRWSRSHIRIEWIETEINPDKATVHDLIDRALTPEELHTGLRVE